MTARTGYACAHPRSCPTEMLPDLSGRGRRVRLPGSIFRSCRPHHVALRAAVSRLGDCRACKQATCTMDAVMCGAVRLCIALIAPSLCASFLRGSLPTAPCHGARKPVGTERTGGNQVSLVPRHPRRKFHGEAYQPNLSRDEGRHQRRQERHAKRPQGRRKADWRRQAACFADIARHHGQTGFGKVRDQANHQGERAEIDEDENDGREGEEGHRQEESRRREGEGVVEAVAPTSRNLLAVASRATGSRDCGIRRMRNPADATTTSASAHDDRHWRRKQAPMPARAATRARAKAGPGRPCMVNHLLP